MNNGQGHVDGRELERLLACAMPPLPAGVSEDDLCDLVCGPGAMRERTPADLARLARVESLVAASPEMAGVVKKLRRDASVLSASAELTRVPASDAQMLDAIERKLSRAAVQELIEAEQSAAPTAVPVWETGRPDVLYTIRSSRAVRRVAVAAGFVLAIGAGYFLVQSVMDAYPKSESGKGLIARGARGGGESAATPENDSGAIDATGIASAGEGEAGSGGTDATDRALASNTDIAPEIASGPAMLDEPAESEITLARAAELAAQGRLVVRVRTFRSEDLASRLRRLEDPRVAGVSVEALSLDALPGEYVALASPASVLSPRGVRGGPDQAPIEFLDDGGGALGSGVGAGASGPQSPVVDPQPAVAGVYVADVLPEEASVESLRRVLSAALRSAEPAGAARTYRGFSAEVSLEEAPADAGGPELDAESVLWWTQPASGWMTRARVPVVVETLK